MVGGKMSKIVGSLKIRDFIGCSESTFMQYVTNEGLPVKKVKGEFVSTSAKLDKWLGAKDQAEADPDEAATAKAAKEQAEADEAQAFADQEQAEADAAQAKADKEKAEAKAAKKAAGK